VSPRSQTETYAALNLFVDNWRWQGVPFYLRTAKCLPRQFFGGGNPVPLGPAPVLPAGVRTGLAPVPAHPVDPARGRHRDLLQAKYPGPNMLLRPVEMKFT